MTYLAMNVSAFLKFVLSSDPYSTSTWYLEEWKKGKMQVSRKKARGDVMEIRCEGRESNDMNEVEGR